MYNSMYFFTMRVDGFKPVRQDQEAKATEEFSVKDGLSCVSGMISRWFAQTSVALLLNVSKVSLQPVASGLVRSFPAVPGSLSSHCRSLPARCGWGHVCATATWWVHLRQSSQRTRNQNPSVECSLGARAVSWRSSSCRDLDCSTSTDSQVTDDQYLI